MWAWAAHNSTWQDVLAICDAVDRPNFGVCLDTFQICARAFADPTAPDGLVSSRAPSELTASLKDLIVALEADNNKLREKVFYFQVKTKNLAHRIAENLTRCLNGQISDGSANILPQDLVKLAKDQGLPPLYAWSNSWRPIPYQDQVEGDVGPHYLRGYSLLASDMTTRKNERCFVRRLSTSRRRDRGRPTIWVERSYELRGWIRTQCTSKSLIAYVRRSSMRWTRAAMTLTFPVAGQGLPCQLTGWSSRGFRKRALPYEDVLHSTDGGGSNR
jgi:hypothetical protein